MQPIERTPDQYRAAVAGRLARALRIPRAAAVDFAERHPDPVSCCYAERAPVARAADALIALSRGHVAAGASA